MRLFRWCCNSIIKGIQSKTLCVAQSLEYRGKVKGPQLVRGSLRGLESLRVYTLIRYEGRVRPHKRPCLLCISSSSRFRIPALRTPVQGLARCTVPMLGLTYPSLLLCGRPLGCSVGVLLKAVITAAWGSKDRTSIENRLLFLSNKNWRDSLTVWQGPRTSHQISLVPSRYPIYLAKVTAEKKCL